MSARKTGSGRSKISKNAATVRREARLLRTAYHEAGHAVAALLVRRRFKYVTVEPGDDNLGHVLYRRWGESFDPDLNSDSRTERRIENAVFTAFAGHAAEAIFVGRGNWIGSGQDRQTAMYLASYICGNNEELNAYLNLVWIRTRMKLRQPHHWTQVKALAEALVVERKITYRRAKEIGQAASDAEFEEWKRRALSSRRTSDGA
jgi:ATP-dependent Zn protease